MDIVIRSGIDSKLILKRYKFRKDFLTSNQETDNTMQRSFQVCRGVGFLYPVDEIFTRED